MKKGQKEEAEIPVTLLYKSSALRELDKLPEDTQELLINAIDALVDDPLPEGVVKLRGSSDDLYRIRVGDYRIIYSIQSEKQQKDNQSVRLINILVVKVGHRREIYR